MCDGAGNYSSADHSIPANHPMPTNIAHAWLRWAAKAGLDNKIMAHVTRAAPEPPLGGNTWLWRASLDAWTGDYVEKTTLTPTERGQPNAIYIRYTPPFPADELKAKWLPTLHEHCMEYVLEGSPADSVLAVLAATPWLVLKSP